MDNGQRRPAESTENGTSDQGSTARQAASSGAAGPPPELLATAPDETPKSWSRSSVLLVVGAIALLFVVVVAGWALLERRDAQDQLSEARAKLVETRTDLADAQAETERLREDVSRVEALTNVADRLFECLEVMTAQERGVEPRRVDVPDDICLTAIEAYAFAFAPEFEPLPE